MMKAWAKLKQVVRKPWVIPDGDELNQLEDEIEMIHKAGEEVSAARNLFARADDPDMVDWAVFNLTAAERRYDYLLKKYRREKPSKVES